MRKILLSVLSFMMGATLNAADHKFSGTKEGRHNNLYDYHQSGWMHPHTPHQKREYLFESWNSWREKMADKGVTVTSSYTANPLANVAGGLRQGFAYTGSYGIDANVDLERLTCCKGLEFYVAFGWRAGSNLADKVGNQFPPAQVYGNQTWWLNQFYFQQTSCNGRFRGKIGRIEAGDDFLQSPLYYYYVNNAFDGNPIAIFFNAQFSAYPNSQWGAYLEYKVYKDLIAKFAFYGTNPNKAKDNGFNWAYSGKQGTLLINEWWYQSNQQPCDIGMPGNIKLAYYYYTGTFERFVQKEAKSNYGCYLLADQMIIRNGGPLSDRGLSAWGAVLFSPKDRNTFPFFLGGGFVYKGIFPSRCHDVTALGVAYGRYSECLRAAQDYAEWAGIPGTYGHEKQYYEMVIEFNHLFYINKWFYIQPDVQYIANPKGLDSICDAVVIGAQIGITF